MLLNLRICLGVMFCLLAALICCPSFSLAQTYELNWHLIDSPSKFNIPKTTVKKESEAVAQIKKTIPLMYEQGYLAASIDSIVVQNKSYDLYYYCGPQYKFAYLNFDSIPKALLVNAHINESDFKDRPLRPESISRICEQLIRYCEENGYPFAKVWLDSLHTDKNQKFRAQLKINRAELRLIDSIAIEGDVKLSTAFMHRYLDIAKGSLYDEKKLKSISAKIKNLPYVQESLPWELHFKPKETYVSLYLKEKKANQLNAILGLMPNNLQAQKMLLTADMQFALLNFLGHGESINASFQNLQVKSPRIKTDLIWPYLFGTAFGTEVHFDFFSNNLQFRKVSFQSGVQYQISSLDVFKVFYQSFSNRILEIDTLSILNNKQLPTNIDSKSSGIGIAFQNTHLDNKINPKKGWQTNFSLSALQRQIIPNNTIVALNDASGFNYAALYDSLPRKSYQYHIVADAAIYLRVASQLSLKLGYNGGYIFAPNIFQNELFQIGGFKLLRGFDEQSIFANHYQLALCELRLRYTPNSYAFIFSDNAWVETKFNQYQRSSWYNGFGVGTILETKTGLFSIALGFGRSDYIPLRFRESKISFGYVALF